MSVLASRWNSCSLSFMTAATSANVPLSASAFHESLFLASCPSAPLSVRWIRLTVIIGSPVLAWRSMRDWLDCLWS